MNSLLLALFLANGNASPELTTVIGLMAMVVMGGRAAVAASARIAAPTLILLVVAGLVTVMAGRLGFDAARTTYTILRLPIYLGLGIAVMIRYRDIRIPINALILACVQDMPAATVRSQLFHCVVFSMWGEMLFCRVLSLRTVVCR